MDKKVFVLFDVYLNEFRIFDTEENANKARLQLIRNDIDNEIENITDPKDKWLIDRLNEHYDGIVDGKYFSYTIHNDPFLHGVEYSISSLTLNDLQKPYKLLTNPPESLKPVIERKRKYKLLKNL